MTAGSLQVWTFEKQASAHLHSYVGGVVRTASFSGIMRPLILIYGYTEQILRLRYCPTTSEIKCVYSHSERESIKA